MDICKVVAEKATCSRKKVGAVFVNQEHEILATGYNGSPPGFPHCIDVGCILVDNRCIATTHAEQNAIVQAAKRGTSLKDSTLYVTMFPCFNCIKLLIGLKVRKIIYLEEYIPYELSTKYLKRGGIGVEKYVAESDIRKITRSHIPEWGDSDSSESGV